MEKDFQHNNPENWKWGVFYFNRKDFRLIVPKRIAYLGWTLNFANPLSYVIMTLIFVFIMYKIYQ